jgi:hypothetical protein
VRCVKIAMASGCPAAADWGAAALRLNAVASARGSPARQRPQNPPASPVPLAPSLISRPESGQRDDRQVSVAFLSPASYPDSTLRMPGRRCGARTRQGSRCQSPAMPNGRCRRHGGKSRCAPKGNTNAFKPPGPWRGRLSRFRPPGRAGCAGQHGPACGTVLCLDHVITPCMVEVKACAGVFDG